MTYAFTVAPTVAYGGDCGDLIASSFTLTNCHPTGYPLYLLLGKLFSLLPIGEIAFRYNLMSAVFAACAVSLVALTLLQITDEVVAAVTGGLSLAYFYLFWSQSVIAEVYALATALNALQILTVVAAAKTGDWRLTCAFFLASGFAFAHHLSAALVFVPLGLYLLWQTRRGWSARSVYLCSLLTLVPLLLYAYIPVRAAADPSQNFWGDLSDPAQFVKHVSGSLYRPHMFALSMEQIRDRAVTLLALTTISFFAGSVLLLIGLIAAIRSHRALAITLLSIILLNALVHLPYEVGDWILFFFPTYVICSVFVGMGAAVLLSRARSRSSSGAIRTAAIAIVLLCPILQASISFERNNRRGNWRAKNDALDVLSATIPGSRIFVRSDELLFSLWYAQKALRRYQDREVISTSKYVPATRTDKVIGAIVDSAEQEPTYVTFWTDALPREWHLRPVGKVCLVTRQRPLGETLNSPMRDALRLSAIESVKRELLLPVVADWPGHELAIDIAFVKRTSTADPPAADMPKEVAASGTSVTVNAQIIGWLESRTLTGAPGQPSRQKLAFEIPANVLPGTYRIYARDMTMGFGPGKWNRMDEILIVDY